MPAGFDSVVGLIQVRALDSHFELAEWGFAIASPFWGTGLFMESASMVVDFAMDLVGVQRLEARASVTNGRGNGVLKKLGAVEEAVLRNSLLKRGQPTDQVLWSILSGEWRYAKTVWGTHIH